MIIMGIDPAIGSMGIAVIEVDIELDKLKVVELRTVKTKSSIIKQKDGKKIVTKISMEYRLHQIYNVINVMLDCYKPDAVIIEEPVTQYNKHGIIVQGIVIGVIVGTCYSKGYNYSHIYFIHPNEVKLLVAQVGNAEKEEVREQLEEIFKIKLSPKKLDESDALAIAYSLWLRSK